MISLSECVGRPSSCVSATWCLYINRRISIHALSESNLMEACKGVKSQRDESCLSRGDLRTLSMFFPNLRRPASHNYKCSKPTVSDYVASLHLTIDDSDVSGYTKSLLIQRSRSWRSLTVGISKPPLLRIGSNSSFQAPHLMKIVSSATI